MKKLSILWLAICSLMIIGATSCEKDDEPGKENTSTGSGSGSGGGQDSSNPLIGEWQGTEYDDYYGQTFYFRYKFNADGTFEAKDWYEYDREPSYELIGTWAANSNHLYLSAYDDDYTSVVEYAISNNRLFLTFDDGETLVLTRVTSNSGGNSGGNSGNVTSNSIVGEWKYVDTEDGLPFYVQFKFKADGTFLEKEWEYGEREPSYNDGGEWWINGNRLTLMWDGYSEYLDRFEFEVTNNRLILIPLDEDGILIFNRI